MASPYTALFVGSSASRRKDPPFPEQLDMRWTTFKNVGKGIELLPMEIGPIV